MNSYSSIRYKCSLYNSASLLCFWDSFSLSLSLCIKNLSWLSCLRAGLCVAGAGGVSYTLSPIQPPDKDFPSPKRGHQILTLRGTTSNLILPGKVQTVPQPRSPPPTRSPACPPRGESRNSLPNTYESSERLPPRDYLHMRPPPPLPFLAPKAHNKGQDYCFMIILFNLSYNQHY